MNKLLLLVLSVSLSAAAQVSVYPPPSGSGGGVSTVNGVTPVAGNVQLNAASVSADQAGAAAAVGTPVFNVSNYGAKCDGSTNDSTAFNAAVSAAAAVNGQVKVPSTPVGCVLTSQVSIPLNIKFTGSGETSTFLQCKSASLPVCLAVGGNSTSNNIKGGIISDLTVQGPYPIGGPYTGGAIGVWIGGDSAGVILPTGYQANFYSFANVRVSGFAAGYQPGNNSYILNWTNTHTTDNQYGINVVCPAVANSAENFNFHGGAITGGISPINANCDGDNVANPNGDNIEFSLDGVSLDYSTGPLIAGSRITAHISKSHLESAYTPFVYCHQGGTTGVCEVDVSDSEFFVAIPGTTGVGTDAPFYFDAAYSNLTLGAGNYYFSGINQSYLVDWQVPYYAGTKSTLSIGQPWGFDSNFQSKAPGALTNASPYVWGPQLTLPLQPLTSLYIPYAPAPEEGSATLTAANAVNWTEFNVPANGLALTHIGINIATVDATTTNKYDVCIWDSYGTLVADTGALAGGGSVWGSLYAHDIPIAQGSRFLPAGNYFVGWTGTATTAALSTPTYNGQYSVAVHNIGPFAPSTGGACGNVSVPTAGTGSLPTQGLSVVLH